MSHVPSEKSSPPDLHISCVLKRSLLSLLFIFDKWTGEGVNTGVTERIGSTVLMLLRLEHDSHSKLWEDLQVGCGCLVKECTKLTFHILKFCLFKRSISQVLSKWVKNGKSLLGPPVEACGEREGKEGGSLAAVQLQSSCLCFILALLSQNGVLVWNG